MWLHWCFVCWITEKLSLDVEKLPRAIAWHFVIEHGFAIILMLWKLWLRVCFDELNSLLLCCFLLVVIVVIVCCRQWDWMFGCVIATPHAIHCCLFLFSEEQVELTRLIKYFMLFSWILPWVDISVDYVQQ